MKGLERIAIAAAVLAFASSCSTVKSGMSAVKSGAQTVWSRSYYGAAAGQATNRVDKDEITAAVRAALSAANVNIGTATAAIEQKDTAWSLFAGFRLNDYVSFEAGYHDLGAADYEARANIRGQAATVQASIASKGASISGMLVAPIYPDIDMYGRLGMYFADSSIDASAAAGNTNAVASDSASSRDKFFGAGFAYRFREHWRFSLDYNLFKDVGPEGDGEHDVHAVTLSAAYKL